MDSEFKTVLVFIDGLGLGPADPAVNPIHSGVCPVLERLLAEQSVPVDACLGVPGLPQSATGQTALLTGVNAPALLGRHVEGFPGPELKAMVEQHNVFGKLLQRGYRPAFANAYHTESWTDAMRRKMQSVTTVMTLAALGEVRDTDLMLEGRAVYQDLTRASLQERGFDGPLTTPRQSAVDLKRIANEQDFTLFEYFQTDRKGHRGVLHDIHQVLALLDEFLAELIPFADQPGCLFLLTSDHGNIEDFSTRTHTTNPVPLVALGAGAEHFKPRVRKLTDFVPALMELYPGRKVMSD
jgi:2,3-bisphosphoglycerate-independent phosphoglycerate mutase